MSSAVRYTYLSAPSPPVHCGMYTEMPMRSLVYIPAHCLCAGMTLLPGRPIAWVKDQYPEETGEKIPEKDFKGAELFELRYIIVPLVML